jgi:hypothetical protein
MNKERKKKKVQEGRKAQRNDQGSTGTEQKQKN